MAFGATLAEILAAKSGQAAPEIEQSLAHTAEQSEAARMQQQARDYEYDQAQAQASTPDAVSSSANAPSGTDPLAGIVPESTSTPDSSVSLDSSALNPSAPSDADMANFASAQKAQGNFNAVKNPAALAAIGAGGLGAAAIMNTPPPPPSAGGTAGPSPASIPQQAQPQQSALTPEDAKNSNDLKSIMAMLSPQKRPPLVVDTSTGTTLGSDQGLKDAQNQRDKETLINQLGKSAALIGAGLARATPGAADSIFDQNIKDANNRVGDYQARLANQDSDPKSAASQAMRGIALKMGFQFGDQVSAADIQKQIPSLTSYMNHLDADDTKLQTKGLAVLDQRNKMAQAASEKQDKAYSDLASKMETFRGNRVAQQAAMDQYSAQKALDLVKNKDPNTLTTQDLQLLAGEMSKIATGGVPTEHGIVGLMPNNLQTKAAELQNYLLSKPSDANAGAYIKKNMGYLQQMTQTADDNLKSYRQNIATGYKGRVKPEQYDELQQTYGLGNYGKQQAPQGQPSAGGAQYTPDVLNYAKAHNITPDQAMAIKISRTGGQ